MNKNNEDKKTENNFTVADILSRWYIWVPIGYVVGNLLGNSTTACIGLAVGAGFGLFLQKIHDKDSNK